MHHMIIRPLKKTDGAEVTVLIRQLTKNIVAPEKLAKRIASLVKSKDARYLVAQKDNTIIGFGGLVWYTIPSKGTAGWIEELVVDKKYRNKGIGKKLIKELLLLAESQKLTQVKLTTVSPIAKNLYKKAGFIEKQEILLLKKYY